MDHHILAEATCLNLYNTGTEYTLNNLTMADTAGPSSNAVELGAGHVVERAASAQQRAAPAAADGDVKLSMHGESTLYDELVDEHEHFSHRAPTLRAAVLGEQVVLLICPSFLFLS